MNGNRFQKGLGSIAPASVECPSCKKSLRNTTHFQAINLVCSGCGSIINTRKKSVVAKIKKKEVPVIPIGTRGRFKDTMYEVVGYIKFREYRTIYTWNEYILFNPMYGYASLSEFNGHWSYAQQTYIYPLDAYRSFEFMQETFNQFNDYKSTIEYAEGEFNWNILDSEKILVTEYLSPPRMLIKEQSSSELIWFKAEHIEPQEVKDAFKIDDKLMPSKVGFGALQPSSLTNTLPVLNKFTYYVIGALLVLQLLFILLSPDTKVYNLNHTLDSSSSTVSIVSPSFKLESKIIGYDNVEIEIYADVDNNWFEAAITLVNDDTGEEYFFEQGVEYYHGYEWSEGEMQSSKVLSQIPDGTYHLIIKPFVDITSMNKVRFFEITVRRGVSNWSNLFLIFTAIIIYPVIQRIRNNYFEHSRWMNSKYSDD